MYLHPDSQLIINDLARVFQRLSGVTCIFGGAIPASLSNDHQIHRTKTRYTKSHVEVFSAVSQIKTYRISTI